MRRLFQLAGYLECVRAVLGGEAMQITSAYRNRAVNTKVGGVANSDHPLGYAADFKHSTLSAKECCRRIVAAKLPFDQLILERGDSLVHISFNPRMRRQNLRQPGGPGTPISTFVF